MYAPEGEDVSRAQQIKRYLEDALIRRWGIDPNSFAGPKPPIESQPLTSGELSNVTKISRFAPGQLAVTKNLWHRQAADAGITGEKLADIDAAFDSRDPQRIGEAIRSIRSRSLALLRAASAAPAAGSLAEAIGTTGRARGRLAPHHHPEPGSAPGRPVSEHGTRRVYVPGGAGRTGRRPARLLCHGRGGELMDTLPEVLR
jgi:hypothetical protein